MKQSVFVNDGNWYKGNLHTHSTLSDGRQTPEERVKAYKERGYSFLAITDHNLFASYPEFCSDEFIVLPATECDRDAIQLSNPHVYIHAVGVHEGEISEKISVKLPAYSTERKDKAWQDLLDEMNRSGHFAIIAHPVWSRMSIEQLKTLHDYIGIEVYNTTCDRRWYAGKSDYMIDCCLRENKKVLLFASDDCHGDEASGDMFGGWIVVKAKELTHSDIINQIKAGSFYASTGPEIYDFGLEDGKVYVECSPCESINFITYEHLGHSIVNSGVTSGAYQLSGTETFVRCECVDKYGKIAYTNPIFLK